MSKKKIQYMGVNSTVKDLLEIKRGIKEALATGGDVSLPHVLPEDEEELDMAIKREGEVTMAVRAVCLGSYSVSGEVRRYPVILWSSLEAEGG